MKCVHLQHSHQTKQPILPTNECSFICLTEGIRFHWKRKCSLQSNSDSLSNNAETLKENCTPSERGSIGVLFTPVESWLRHSDNDFIMAFPSVLFVSTDSRFFYNQIEYLNQLARVKMRLKTLTKLKYLEYL